MRVTRTRAGWWLMLLGALIVALTSARYFTLDPAVYFPRQRAVYEAHTAWLMLHIAGMFVALLAGPFQFLHQLRNRRRWVHRLLGRVYLVAALAGGVGGLYMAQFSASGFASDVGFSLLALGVLGTTSIAWWRIRAGEVQTHREWMTRSYALLLAAVTLRIYLPLLEAVFSDETAFAIVAWVSWVPNAVVAERMVRAMRRGVREPALVRVRA